MSIADYVYIFADGKIIGSGTPQELEKTEDKKIIQFISGNYDGPVPFNYPTTIDFIEDM